MDIRRPILPVSGAEVVPRTQSSVSDRQRQAVPFRQRDKRKPPFPPEPEDREDAAGGEAEDPSPDARLKGRAVETVVDGLEPGDEEQIQGSNVDVRA